MREQRLESQSCEHVMSTHCLILRGVTAVRCPCFTEWGELEPPVARCDVCVRISVSVTCTLVPQHSHTVQPGKQPAVLLLINGATAIWNGIDITPYF